MAPTDNTPIFGTAVRATVTFSVIQAVVGAIGFALFYKDLVLPPPSFFGSHAYDGFVKIYEIAAAAGLPDLIHGFAAPGIVEKLLLAPRLIAASAISVPFFAFVAAAAVAGALRIRPSVSPRAAFTTAFLTIAALMLAINLWWWFDSVYVPVDANLRALARNYLRDFVFGGTAFACGILAVSTAAGLVINRVLPGSDRLAAAGMAVALLVSFGAAANANPAAPKLESAAVGQGMNVVLISIDSLRADHLGAYGYERATSPTIDDLARNGVRFANNSSSTSWTLPSHMTLMTGRSILGHGVVGDDRSLTADVATLAEAMGSKNYRTGAIVSAPYVEARYGFGRGFDDYDDRTIQFDTHGDSYTEVTAPMLQRAADAWLDSNADAPFFLFLHYWDVHYDYMPGPPYDTMFDPDYDGDIDGRNFYFNPKVHKGMDKRDLDHVIALYDGEIRLVDDHLAKLRQSLARVGVADNTIIVVVADHGDEFFEHGRKGHHRSLYSEVLHVPWVMNVPGKTPSQPVVSMQTSLMDVMPTILGVVGIDVPEGVEGFDLSSITYGNSSEWDRSTHGELYRTKSLNVQLSLQTSDQKLVHHFKRRRAEGYDLTQDPTEQHAEDAGSARSRELSKQLGEWLDDRWPTFRERIRKDGVNTLAMDAETEARLRSLGYIQ